MNWLTHSIESQGAAAPGLFVALFLGSSFLMIWRLEAVSAGGLKGTALGTLITPYCSGMGNLLFAVILGRSGGPGADVMINSLVNNVTNLTLLIGLPAIFWPMNVLPAGGAGKKKRGANREHEANRLDLLLTLTAVLFFTAAVWVLGRRGRLDFYDGLVLIGLFLFWQSFHVFDVLKSNVRQGKKFRWTLWLNLALLVMAAYAQYVSIEWLVRWLSHIHHGFISAKHLGWLSGWLMVVPNGLLAVYYGWRGNPEIVYTSQVGDGHVSIPLCIGVFTLFRSFALPPVFETGMVLLFAAAAVHLFCVGVLGRLPRFMGWVLVAAYALFLYKGLIR